MRVDMLLLPSSGLTSIDRPQLVSGTRPHHNLSIDPSAMYKLYQVLIVRLGCWETVEDQGSAGSGLLTSAYKGPSDQNRLYQLNQSPITIPTLAIPSLPHPAAALESVPHDANQPTSSDVNQPTATNVNQPTASAFDQPTAHDVRRPTGDCPLPSACFNVHFTHSALTWCSCSAGVLNADHQPDKLASISIHEVILLHGQDGAYMVKAPVVIWLHVSDDSKLSLAYLVYHPLAVPSVQLGVQDGPQPKLFAWSSW